MDLFSSQQSHAFIKESRCWIALILLIYSPCRFMGKFPCNTPGTQIKFNAINVTSSVKLPESLTDDLQVTSVLNGDMAIDDVTTEFSKFTDDLTLSWSGVALKTNGSIKGSCVDEWVTVDTKLSMRAKPPLLPAQCVTGCHCLIKLMWR